MWRLGRSLPERSVGGPKVVGEDSVRLREVALGLRPGQPFLLRPDGGPDLDVLAYFFSPSFGLLSEQSQLSYAKDLRLFLKLHGGQGRRWRRPRRTMVWITSSGVGAMGGTRVGCRPASSLGSGPRASGSMRGRNAAACCPRLVEAWPASRILRSGLTASRVTTGSSGSCRRPGTQWRDVGLAGRARRRPGPELARPERRSQRGVRRPAVEQRAPLARGRLFAHG